MNSGLLSGLQNAAGMSQLAQAQHRDDLHRYAMMQAQGNNTPSNLGGVPVAYPPPEENKKLLLLLD